MCFCFAFCDLHEWEFNGRVASLLVEIEVTQMLLDRSEITEKREFLFYFRSLLTDFESNNLAKQI